MARPLSKPLQDRLDGQKAVIPFAEAYMQLCKEHEAYVSFNYYGTEVIVKDGISYPIHALKLNDRN